MTIRPPLPDPDPADPNPPGDGLSKRRLKTWIRLLRATRHAENQLREFLRVEHATTLPRFDVMAALYRRRGGVTMSELSRMLLVSNGNATAVVDRLERDGLVLRRPEASDRRAVRVTLTEQGLRQFEALALGHEQALDSLMGALDAESLDALSAILRRLPPNDGG